MCLVLIFAFILVAAFVSIFWTVFVHVVLPLFVITLVLMTLLWAFGLWEPTGS